MLAKALAHDFESKLLLLDVSDFSMKVTMNKFHSFSLCFHWIVLILSIISLLQMQSKYGCSKKESVSFLFHVLMNWACSSGCWISVLLRHFHIFIFLSTLNSLIVFVVFQKVHFWDDIGTNVLFVWIFLNPFSKGRNKVGIHKHTPQFIIPLHWK